MIAKITHEIFPHLRAHNNNFMLIFIYIYTYIHTHIYIYKHTHTKTGQQVDLPRTAACLKLRPNDCNYYARVLRCICGSTGAIPCYILYIYIYIQTHIYIYKHTHKETGQQAHITGTAPCLKLRRNEFNYHARDIRCTFAPTAASPC
jgi:hypothetical protein